MEDVLTPSPVTPPPALLASAAVLTRWRSHPDSASYRTLSRISPTSSSSTHRPQGHRATRGGARRCERYWRGGDSPQVPRGADFDLMKDVEK
jgi:hypothetical protein